jgi:hypothetical protein
LLEERTPSANTFRGADLRAPAPSPHFPGSGRSAARRRREPPAGADGSEQFPPGHPRALTVKR